MKEIELIERFMKEVIKDLESPYKTNEGEDWKRGAQWGLKRGKQIMEKRLKRLTE